MNQRDGQDREGDAGHHFAARAHSIPAARQAHHSPAGTLDAATTTAWYQASASSACTAGRSLLSCVQLASGLTRQTSPVSVPTRTPPARSGSGVTAATRTADG